MTLFKITRNLFAALMFLCASVHASNPSERAEILFRICCGDLTIESAYSEEKYKDFNMCVKNLERNIKILSSPDADMGMKMGMANLLCKDPRFCHKKEYKQIGLRFFEELSLLGKYSDAQYMFSFFLLKEDDPECVKKGLKWLEISANAGETMAMNGMALNLLNSTWCEDTLENKKKGMAWLEKAAKLGCPASQSTLGRYMVRGMYVDNTKENKKKGIEWLEKAAEAGIVYAMNDLGVFLIQSGEEQKKGIEWIMKAADLGHAVSMSNLGLLMIKNKYFKDTKENKKKAVEWLEKAANAGVISSMNELGKALVGAIGCENTPENKRKGIEVFIKASDGGDAVSSFQIAYFYFTGMSVLEKDFQKAIYYFERANDKYLADDYMGFCYLKLSEYRKSLKHYELARRRGAFVSDAMIKYLESKANPQFQDRKKSKNNSKSRTIQGIQSDLDQQKIQLLQQYDSVSTQLKKLEELKVKNNYKSDAGDEVSAEELKKYRDDFVKNHKSTLANKQENISLFQDYLMNIKDKIFHQNQALSISIRMENQRKTIQDHYDAFGVLSVDEESREAKASAKKNAQLVLDQEKEKAHAKHNKSNAKKKKKKSKKTVPIATQAETKAIGPFSDTRLIVKTEADIPEAAMQKAYTILNGIRDSRTIDEVVNKLKSLDIKVDIKKISSDYAGCPEADVVYEARINNQYRVIIPFIHVKNEAIANDNNNRTPESDVTTLIYQSEIYICDPHVKQ
ncbi:MAG: sel1 repeat family protein [Alphaproteobacteria bacterium]|nr:sel1 repeat family protein [Alphaproteobacteria bacterium]